jgi:hypothetical protein
MLCLIHGVGPRGQRVLLCVRVDLWHGRDGGRRGVRGRRIRTLLLLLLLLLLRLLRAGPRLETGWGRCVSVLSTALRGRLVQVDIGAARRVGVWRVVLRGARLAHGSS